MTTREQIKHLLNEINELKGSIWDEKFIEKLIEDRMKEVDPTKAIKNLEDTVKKLKR